MREELKTMFAATNLLTYSEQDFLLVKLPLSTYAYLLARLADANHSAFETVVRSHDEVTLVATAELWRSIEANLEASSIDGPWRLITLDITIPLDVFGYMEQVSRICARCGASMVVESSYSTDHLLIKADRYRDVLEGLNEFIQQCRESVHSGG